MKTNCIKEIDQATKANLDQIMKATAEQNPEWSKQEVKEYMLRLIDYKQMLLKEGKTQVDRRIGKPDKLHRTVLTKVSSDEDKEISKSLDGFANACQRYTYDTNYARF